MKNPKRIYVILFLIFSLPFVFLFASVEYFFSRGWEGLGEFLFIGQFLNVINLGLLPLTTWYALKLKKSVWVALMFGLLSLIPPLNWIFFIILLNSKVKNDVSVLNS